MRFSVLIKSGHAFKDWVCPLNLGPGQPEARFSGSCGVYCLDIHRQPRRSSTQNVRRA